MPSIPDGDQFLTSCLVLLKGREGFKLDKSGQKWAKEDKRTPSHLHCLQGPVLLQDPGGPDARVDMGLQELVVARVPDEGNVQVIKERLKGNIII